MQLTLEQLKKAFSEDKTNTGVPAEVGATKDLNIKVLSIEGDERTSLKTGKTYIMMEVTYRSQEFGAGTKKVPLWHATQAPIVIGMTEGRNYVVHMVRGEKFWDWVSADLLYADGTIEETIGPFGANVVTQ